MVCSFQDVDVEAFVSIHETPMPTVLVSTNRLQSMHLKPVRSLLSHHRLLQPRRNTYQSLPDVEMA